MKVERKKEYKVTKNGWQDNPEVVEQLIREKVATMTSRNSDQIRQAMKIFGGKTAITVSEFRKIVKRLGIEASDVVTETLFRRYDTSGDQHLDLYEFVKALMPADHTRETFNVTAEKTRKTFEDDYKRKAMLPELMPQHLEKWKKGPVELERLLMEKLESRVSSKAKQLGARQSFKLFSKGCKTWIERQEFIQCLRYLGFLWSPEEIDQLFRRYDKNGDGVIDYKEFTEGLFPYDGDRTNKNVHRPLVRDELVDECPNATVGESANLFTKMSKEEADAQGWRRTKKGPLYYSALPDSSGIAPKVPPRIHVLHTPPDFEQSAIGVPLLKDSEKRIGTHYATGINKSNKVYNEYFPPSTATKSKPPWAATDARTMMETLPSHRSRGAHSVLSSRGGHMPDTFRSRRSGGLRSKSSSRMGGATRISLLGDGADIYGGRTL